MELNPQKKHPKQPAKGMKQALDENKETLNFYLYLSFGVNFAYILINFVWLRLFTFWYILVFILCLLVYTGCYRFMLYMAEAKYTETGQLLDSGVDLNLEGGIAEHVKDLIILTAACQLLSLLTNYSWFLWLLVPIRVFWLVWINFLGPYFFQQEPQNPSGISEKKQKRIERRLKRKQ